MKLFVNGCSFTHGHKDWLANKTAPSWVWPSLISDNFDDYVNLAWQGGSNQRIFRTTLDFFDNIADTSEWLAIIQWTNPHARDELYDLESNTYYGYLASSNEPVLDHDAYTKLMKVPKKFYRNIELHKIATLVKTPVEVNHYFIQQNFVLSEFFKRKGIKFLFVGVSAHAVISPETTHPLAKLLPYDYMLQTPISYFVNNETTDLVESEIDNHPNKAGHQVLANYIADELKRRNYL